VGATLLLTVVLSGTGQSSTYPGLAEDAYLELPGVRLFYVDSGGGGVPVILLHSATGTSRVWEHQMPAITAAGYRVIAYDRRGFGRTVAGESAPPAAADDLEALRAHLGLERFHLVGTAAGGMVAVDYAQSYPHRLLRLVVANSIVGVQDEEYLALGRRLRPPEFAKLPPDLRELGPSYRAANPGGTDRWLALERESRAPGEAPPAQPFKNRTTFASLSTIRVPTLLITGGADLYTPPPVLRLFAERIPEAETLVLPEVGHAAYWEAPSEFNRAVLEFLGRSPR
jgi:pimeloyl-ACP methyl ester carboxylesterase